MSLGTATIGIPNPPIERRIFAWSIHRETLMVLLHRYGERKTIISGDIADGSCRKFSPTHRSTHRDKAYDSDAARDNLATEYYVEMIAPTRASKRGIQDGRTLRRYCRHRWKYHM
jgi:hypothetical protein